VVKGENMKIEIGMKFGKLTVINYYGKIKSRDCWECVCDCNPDKIKVIKGSQLLQGNTNSCGCLRKEMDYSFRNKYTKENMVGQVFGNLFVVDIVESKYRKDAKLICSCSCGNENVLVSMDSVIEGVCKSCGCLVEKTRFQKKYNEYDLESEYYGIGFSTNGNGEFYFDKSDYNLINEYCWRVTEDGYVTSQLKEKEIKFHRLVMKEFNNDNQPIDHMNGMKNDNRKENLRVATQSENCMNSIHQNNSTSGVKGIVFSKEHNKYRARITVNKKVLHLGYFENLDDAIQARNDAEEKYFGEFSPAKRGNFLQRALNLLTGNR
jgi:hypothetical protein